jgi:hypothetical protein
LSKYFFPEIKVKLYKNYMLCNSNALTFLILQSITAIDIVEATASEKRQKPLKPRENSLKRQALEE